MPTGEHADQLTRLLNAANGGDGDAIDRLWRTIYDEVHEMARIACATEGSRTQLQPTLLVSEIYLRFFGESLPSQPWENRRHFWGSVARGMSQFLIDLARREGRMKRGGRHTRISLELVAGELEDVRVAMAGQGCEALVALDRLERASPESAEVARLRFVSGFSVEQTAVMLGIAPRTVCKRWAYAKAWIRRALSQS